MSKHEVVASQYAAEVARQHGTGDGIPTGRWLVQRWDESKGIYRDELATDRADLAEHGFRQSKEHRIVDRRINDVAADYPRTSYAQERGDAEYSPRSQFLAALHRERPEPSRNPSPNGGESHAAAADTFLKATNAEERRAASERHPQLTRAFALEASYARLAQRIEGTANQVAFTNRMREHIAVDIANGRPLTDMRLREEVGRQTAHEHVRGR